MIAKIDAPAQVNVDNGELVVKCAPSGNEFNFISRLEIKRKLVSESTYTTILYVEDPPRGSKPMFRDGKWRTTVNVINLACTIFWFVKFGGNLLFTKFECF